MYKNIAKSTVVELKDLVNYQPGQVASKTLVQNEKVSITLFSFAAGEEISSHASGGDALVTVLEGQGQFSVGDEVFHLYTGQSLIMPSGIPHAILAVQPFKMMLVVSF